MEMNVSFMHSRLTQEKEPLHALGSRLVGPQTRFRLGRGQTHLLYLPRIRSKSPTVEQKIYRFATFRSVLDS
jgi:hypothetical protein